MLTASVNAWHSALHLAATAKRRDKYIDKHEGSRDRGNQFALIVHAFNGAFIPQGTQAIGIHADMLLKVLQTTKGTKLGKLGDRPLSSEKYTIRKWARSAADTKEGGMGFSTLQ